MTATLKLETILCPTDFSDCSTRAVEYATDLAKSFGSTLRLLHVVQIPLYVGMEDGPATVAATTRYLDELRETIGKKLEEAAARCAAAGVKATTQTDEGSAHEAIVKASAQADLVVMGTHGRSGLPRLVLGSVAERVVRLAQCPVLTVPPAKP